MINIIIPRGGSSNVIKFAPETMKDINNKKLNMIQLNNSMIVKNMMSNLMLGFFLNTVFQRQKKKYWQINK